MRRYSVRCFVVTIIVLLTAVFSVSAQTQAGTVPEDVFNGLQWRLLGPFRGGRVVAVAGVPGSSTTFYFGSVGGGIWKTTDAGTTWNPIFDHQSVASIGALAVAPSNPDVIYAGTGESDIRLDLGSGDGVYKSTDAGATWKNMGLKDTRQISRIVIDPTNPDIVYVGALGHAYGPNPERGVYKSTDGGNTWSHVLDKGPEIGVADLAMSTDNPKVLFAALWNAHRPPWSVYGPIEGPGSSIYRSQDGGETWTAVTSPALPAGDWGRIGVAVSTDGKRIYALIEAKKGGLYRSDDGGDTWSLANDDARLTSRAWYFQRITVDPQNRDVIYMPNIALYRSEDGGKSITVVRGAPGGDDYHQLWVDPKDSSRLLLGVDQGTTISLDKGKTWTTWYNQPIAQMYHVITDNQFPYVVYGAQQDSGAAAIYSRTDHQLITPRDWFLPGNSESGYIAPDPNNPNIVYMSGTNGVVTRTNLKTNFSQTITPWPMNGFGVNVSQMKYRSPWTPMLVFSAFDHKTLYLGTQFVLKTMDGGLHWEKISPDLTGALPSAKGDKSGDPKSIAIARDRGYGLINAIATSSLNGNLLWAGSDSGLIYITRDAGKSWKDITPKEFGPWSKVSIIEASHFDPAVAYVAVDKHEIDDQRPYIYRTKDYGATWKLVVDGIKSNSFAWSVHEDPKQKNLLFAGTELGLYVSFNGGDMWQPLQLNLPVVSIRDTTVHGNDLIVATHGRSFWALDDISPLRQAAAAANAQGAYLFRPAKAMRIDNDTFNGTPLPPEEPTAKNPPEGAVIDYYLKSDAREVTLEILTSDHQLVRRFSSDAKPRHGRPPQPIAERWFPKPQILEVTPGMHRFLWNLNWSNSGDKDADDDDDNDYARSPRGPSAIPGAYEVRLTVDGKVSTEPLMVVMDPRTAATPADLALQLQTGKEIFLASLQSRKALAEINSVQEQIQTLKKQIPQSNNELNKEVADFDSSLRKILGARNESQGSEEWGLILANSGLTTSLGVVEGGERTPPAQAMDIYRTARRSAEVKEQQWNKLKTTELVELNKHLQAANVAPVAIAEIQEEVHYLMTR
jgi:photosystem II stability/assembly factor-like uncharacterized protein